MNYYQQIELLRKENEHLRNVLASMSDIKEQGRKRRLIWASTNGHCFYCGDVLEVGEWEIEHRQPKSVGGDNGLCNLVPSCRKCNRRKGTRNTEEFRQHLQDKDFDFVLKPVVFYGEMVADELTSEERIEAIAYVHTLLDRPYDSVAVAWIRLAREGMP